MTEVTGTRRSVRWLITAAKVTVSVAAICFLLRGFDFAKVMGVVRRAELGYLFLGVALAPLVPLCLSARFVAVLRKAGIKASFGKVVKITWIGQFWNFFLPGSAGGDLYRLAYVWRLNAGDRSQGFFAVFSDRVIATFLLLPFALFGFAILAPAGMPGLQRPAWFGYAVRAVALVFVVLIIGGMIFRRAISGALQSRWQAVVGKFRNASVYFKPDRNLTLVIFWALVGHLINFAVFFCFCRALGLKISIQEVVLMLPPIIIMLMLPISINGHGVREFLFMFFFGAIGVGKPAAGSTEMLETVLALSLIGLSVDLICNLPGGIMFAFARDEQGEESKPLSVA